MAPLSPNFTIDRAAQRRAEARQLTAGHRER